MKGVLASIIFLSFVNICYGRGDAIERGVKQAGIGELLDMTIPGVTVRECSCDEQNSCVEEIKDQVFKCGDECFYKFNKVCSLFAENDLKQTNCRYLIKQMN